MSDLNRSEGQTVVIVTHDPGAAAIAGRVIFLRDGVVAGEIPGGERQRVIDAFAALDPVG